MLGRPGCLYEKQRTCNLFTVTCFFCVTPGKGGGVNYINPKQINVWQPLKGCGKWLEIEPSLQSPNLKLWWFLLDSQTENTDLISNWSWTIDCMTGPHCLSFLSPFVFPFFLTLSLAFSFSLLPLLFYLLLSGINLYIKVIIFIFSKYLKGTNDWKQHQLNKNKTSFCFC